jgi:hypothetical protein
MNQEKKARLAPAIKAVLKKYNMKGSIGVQYHSTLVVNIKSGPLDIIGNSNSTKNYLQVNTYWIDSHYTGKVKNFLLELRDAMMDGNHDRSDIQTDYFDVGWWIDINVGQYNKPYVVTK